MAHSPWSLHLRALMLALASSTDNFAVGFSVAISSSSSSSSTNNFRQSPSSQLAFFQLNLFIAVCNATGALLATTVGSSMRESLNQLAPLLASLAFAYLGYQQLQTATTPSSTKPNSSSSSSGASGPNEQQQQQQQQQALSYAMAIPMTLNNLASGVAGGAVGVDAHYSFLYALLASVLAMSSGHALAKCGLRYSAKSSTSSSSFSVLFQLTTCDRIAAIVYLTLSVVGLCEALFR